MAYPEGLRKENSPVEDFLTKGADLLALRQEKSPPKKRYKSSDRSELVFAKHLRARTNPGSTIREAKKQKPPTRGGFCFYGVPGGITLRFA